MCLCYHFTGVMNKDTNSSVESGNTILHDMAVEGNPPNIYKQQCGVPKKGFYAWHNVNKLSEMPAEMHYIIHVSCMVAINVASW